MKQTAVPSRAARRKSTFASARRTRAFSDDALERVFGGDGDDDTEVVEDVFTEESDPTKSFSAGYEFPTADFVASGSGHETDVVTTTPVETGTFTQNTETGGWVDDNLVAGVQTTYDPSDGSYTHSNIGQDTGFETVTPVETGTFIHNTETGAWVDNNFVSDVQTTYHPADDSFTYASIAPEHVIETVTPVETGTFFHNTATGAWRDDNLQTGVQTTFDPTLGTHQFYTDDEGWHDVHLDPSGTETHTIHQDAEYSRFLEPHGPFLQDGHEPGASFNDRWHFPQIPSVQIPVSTFHTLTTGSGNGSPIDSAEVVKTMRDQLGVVASGDALHFDRSQYEGILSKNPSAPFTGHGATGVTALDQSVPVSDLAAMMRYHNAESDLARLNQQRSDIAKAFISPPEGISPEWEARRQELVELQAQRNDRLIGMSDKILTKLEPTVGSYKNPLDDDPARLWDEATREQQAKLLLESPINTLHRDAYGDQLPTRREVVEAAARKYDVDPAVVGAFLLHEQRDQSSKEDRADFMGATAGKRDTSIGLGQILMSTAMKNNVDALSDTVDESARSGLSRDGVARLLTSDEHNIFAAAKYIRSVADKGAAFDSAPSALPATRREYPSIDFGAYRTNAWGRNPDNVMALASEYTSKPWDDVVLNKRSYPGYVLLAAEDIRRAGIFSRP
jgi:hypothetical protein